MSSRFHCRRSVQEQMCDTMRNGFSFSQLFVFYSYDADEIEKRLLYQLDWYISVEEKNGSKKESATNMDEELKIKLYSIFSISRQRAVVWWGNSSLLQIKPCRQHSCQWNEIEQTHTYRHTTFVVVVSKA